MEEDRTNVCVSPYMEMECADDTPHKYSICKHTVTYERTKSGRAADGTTGQLPVLQVGLTAVPCLPSRDAGTEGRLTPSATEEEKRRKRGTRRRKDTECI